jgi:hypothetical protein
VDIFTPRPLYSKGKNPWYAMDRRPSRSGRGGEEKNFQPLLGLEPPIIQPIAQRYTTELTRLLSLSPSRCNSLRSKLRSHTRTHAHTHRYLYETEYSEIFGNIPRLCHYCKQTCLLKYFCGIVGGHEIKSRLISGNPCYYSVQNLLSSRLISKNLKIKL